MCVVGIYTCYIAKDRAWIKGKKNARKEAPGAYPHLMKVIKNHTRSSDQIIQFMKKHISVDSNMCNCRACELDLFKPLRMHANRGIHKTSRPSFSSINPQAQVRHSRRGLALHVVDGVNAFTVHGCTSTLQDELGRNNGCEVFGIIFGSWSY